MPNATLTPLVESVSEALESLAFMFAEAQPSSPPPSTDVDGVAVVHFYGPMNGALVVQLSGGVLAALAANMLGTDDVPSYEDQQDALGELANVVCGNVLPRIAGRSAVFGLSVPQSADRWHAAIGSREPASWVTMSVEQGRVDVAMIVASEA